MTIQKNKKWFSRFLQWGSITVAVVLSAITLLDYRHQHLESIEHTGEDAVSCLDGANERLTQYMDRVVDDLKYIASEEDVIRMNRNSYNHVKRLYENHYKQDRLSEIYIIKADFDGKRRPFMVFEKEVDDLEEHLVHTPEREEHEYAVQLSHVKNFTADPELKVQYSSLIPLCVEENGFVVSVPVWNKNKFVGMISAMIPDKNYLMAIGEGYAEGLLVVGGNETVLMVENSANEKASQWFKAHLQSSSPKDFFSRGSDFNIDGYDILTKEIDLGGPHKWFLAHIHNTKEHIKAEGTLGLLTGYGTAVIVMMLGLTSCLLSRNLAVRQKAEAELKNAHSRLEERVLERTQELSTANARLKTEISDRMQAEQTLLLKQFSLDKTTELIVWTDPSGKFIDVNQAVCDFLGYTREEMLEMSVHDTDVHLSKEKWPQYWEDLKKQGSSIMETELRTKEGNVFPIEIATNYVNYNGQEYLFAFAHEITERKNAEDALRKTNQELREYTRLKNDFVITVSHELRTPLTIFKNIISNILAGVMGPVKTKQRETLETANKEVDRLAKIISDFLDISKLEAGKVKLYAREIDIQTIIGDSVDLLQHLAHEKNITLNVDMPEKELMINADYDKMIQIMKNLLDNAIKFVPDCGGSVDIRVRDLGNEIEIDVEDNGYGIESDDISKVFNRFVQVKKQVGPGSHGTGLGLAISKELIELHSGNIWVENTPEGGANFCFAIPKNLSQLNDPAPEPSRERRRAER